MILLLSALKLNTFHLRAILLLRLPFFFSLLLLLAIYSEVPLILLYAFSFYSGDMGPKLALCRHQGPRPRTPLKPTSELGLKCLYILARRSLGKINLRKIKRGDGSHSLWRYLGTMKFHAGHQLDMRRVGIGSIRTGGVHIRICTSGQPIQWRE